MPNATSTDKIYDRTVAEMAETTGFSQSAFLLWIRQKRLSAVPEKGKYLLDESEVMAFVPHHKTRRKFLHHNSTG